MVSGEAAGKKGMYRVPHGTPISEIMAAADVKDPFRIVGGSILAGNAVFSTEAPVNRGIKELLFLSEAEVSEEEEVNCIRCGRCADVCPVGLKPYELNALAIVRDFDSFFAERGGMCVECGLCSYICPSKRHLTQSFKTAKKVKR
jgi:Na+-translocating ferredoxin:NAD+ oxidoreductase RnfC subunit